MADNFKFSDKLVNRIKKNVQDELRKRMLKGIEDVTDFYLDEVDKFYNEYSPIVYRRHPFSNVKDSGLAKTFQPIYSEQSNNNKFTVYGGIALNTYQMYTDYNGRNDWVLWSFTQGYHGLPEPYETYRGKFRPIIDTNKFIEKELKKIFNSKINLDEI